MTSLQLNDTSARVIALVLALMLCQSPTSGALHREARAIGARCLRRTLRLGFFGEWALGGVRRWPGLAGAAAAPATGTAAMTVIASAAVSARRTERRGVAPREGLGRCTGASCGFAVPPQRAECGRRYNRRHRGATSRRASMRGGPSVPQCRTSVPGNALQARSVAI